MLPVMLPVMLIADIVLSTEAVLIVGGLLSALTGALVVIFKLLQVSQKAQLHEVVRQRDIYQEMIEESMGLLEKSVRDDQRRRGMRVPDLLAPVVPEHSSPVSPEDEATAVLQTMRARLTAVNLALGLPPRVAETKEADPDGIAPAPSPGTPEAGTPEAGTPEAGAPKGAGALTLPTSPIPCIVTAKKGSDRDVPRLTIAPLVGHELPAVPTVGQEVDVQFLPPAADDAQSMPGGAK